MVCWSAFSLVWRGWMLILGKRPKNWLSFRVRSRLRDWLHLSGPIQTPPHDRHALNCVASEQERHQKSITEHAAQHQRND